MEALDHKCPSCGAKLIFHPEMQKWNCEYCGSSYSLVELIEQEVKIKKNQRTIEELDCYHCPNCGAQIVADGTTTATFCVYCGNTSILKEKLNGEFKPSKIIPFHTTKEQAIQAFCKLKKGKLFAPKAFHQEQNIQKITGVYIPFWLYDCTTNGSLILGATNVKSWLSGDYRYTETKYYVIEREGSMQFTFVPVDSSSKFEDDKMDAIEPFDYDDLHEFHTSYLSGFFAENYDVTKEDASGRMKKRVEKTTIEELMNTVVGNYTSKMLKTANTDVQINKIEYVLLPVWMLNIQFKKKSYLFAMNGQTGKIVGNIPIDKRKLIFIWLVLFLIFTGVFSLITYLFRMMG